MFGFEYAILATLKAEAERAKTERFETLIQGLPADKRTELRALRSIALDASQKQWPTP